jgi:hypothetical protein
MIHTELKEKATEYLLKSLRASEQTATSSLVTFPFVGVSAFLSQDNTPFSVC